MAAGVIGSESAYAAPAAPTILTTEQPDGTAFRARQFGDEWAHGLETVDGYTVVQEPRTGVWQYATRGRGGRLRPNGRVVGRDRPGSVRRHLRDEVIERQGALRASAVPTAEPVELSPAIGAFAPSLVAPTTTHHNLVILAEFDDQASLGTTPAQWNDRFFGQSGSLKEYYEEVSYGQFTVLPAADTHGVAGDGIVGWIPVGIDHPYPENQWNPADPGNSAYLDEDTLAVKAAIEASVDYVDYAQYDTNNDGYVSPEELHITVIAAGYEQSYGGSTPAIWGHRYALVINDAWSLVPADGKQVGLGYTAFGEMHFDHQATLGIVAHEFGHDIGWPDLYDTDSDSAGAGVWSVMASGTWARASGQAYAGMSPTHPDAWSKYYQGWTTPTAVAGTVADAAIAAASSPTNENVALRLGKNAGGPTDWAWTGGGQGEYFLVENRQPTAGSYDASLPASGLLIWHVNEAQGNNANNSNRLVALEQADGLNSLNLDVGTNRGDGGDPYPGTSGNRSFGPATNPSSAFNDASPSAMSVLDVSDSAATMTADVTGVASADLGLSNAATVSYDTVTFTASLNNAGPSPADEVVVSQTIPAGLTVKSANSTQGSCTVGAAAVTCSLGVLANGATATAAITATTATTGDFTATATVSSRTEDPTAANNSHSTTATVSRLAPPSADLSVSQSAAVVYDEVTLTASVENWGPDTAEAVDFIETLPSGLSAVSASASQGSCTIGPTVTCDLGDVAAGGTPTVQITATASSTGEYTATAAVSSPTGDPTPANNSGSTTAGVERLAPPAADVSVSQSAAVVSDSVTLTAVVANAGPDTAEDVMVTHTLPAGLSAITATTSTGICAVAATVTCDVGDLPQNATVTVAITATTAATGAITASVSVSSSTHDPTPANNNDETTATLMERAPAADVSIAHSAAVDYANVTYAVSVSNGGPDAAEDVVVTQTVPEGLDAVAASTSQGTCVVGTVVTCEVGTVTAGSNPIVEITGTATGVGMFSATATASSATNDPAVGNNNGSAVATVVQLLPPIADLRVSLSAEKRRPSRDFRYVVAVTNAGGAAAVDAALTVQLPFAVQLQQVLGATCTGTSSLVCALGTVDPGGVSQVTVVARPATTGPLSATATATTSSAELDELNNTATAVATAQLLCDNDATAGNDIVVGTKASEMLCGLGGNDTLIGGGGADLLFGGAGLDLASYKHSPNAVAVHLGLQGLKAYAAVPRFSGTVAHGKDNMFSIEQAAGSAYSDVLAGTGAANKLWGLAGRDTLYGRAGRDTLQGGVGLDTLYGGGGTDTCRDLADARFTCER